MPDASMVQCARCRRFLVIDPQEEQAILSAYRAGRRAEGFDRVVKTFDDGLRRLISWWTRRMPLEVVGKEVGDLVNDAYVRIHLALVATEGKDRVDHLPGWIAVNVRWMLGDVRQQIARNRVFGVSPASADDTRDEDTLLSSHPGRVGGRQPFDPLDMGWLVVQAVVADPARGPRWIALAVPGADPEEVCAAVERATCVAGAVQELPATRQAILAYCASGQHTLREVGALLDMPWSSVNTANRANMKRLRAALTAQGYGASLEDGPN